MTSNGEGRPIRIGISQCLLGEQVRLGNAVPPVMMMRISAAVREGVLARISGGTTQGERIAASDSVRLSF